MADFDPAAFNKFAEASDRKEAFARAAELSRREKEVLEGLMRGETNRGIAERLGLSVRTVEMHRARMMRRLGVGSLAEAYRIGLLGGLRSE